MRLRSCASSARGVTLFPLVPPVLLGLAGMPNLSRELFPKVRFMLSAAAPMPPGPAERVTRATGIPVLQAYGMTEASPLTHHNPIEPELIRVASGGTPVYDTQQKVEDWSLASASCPSVRWARCACAGHR